MIHGTAGAVWTDARAISLAVGIVIIIISISSIISSSIIIIMIIIIIIAIIMFRISRRGMLAMRFGRRC